MSDSFKLKTTKISVGLTYIGRDEPTRFTNPNFNFLTNAYAARLSISYNSVYTSSEINYKSPDVIVQLNNQVKNIFLKSRTALLINLDYSKKGFGVDAKLSSSYRKGYC